MCGVFPCSNVLVCNMQLLMSGVDMLYQDTNRLVSYEKNVAKQLQMKQQFIQKRVRHNMSRPIALTVLSSCSMKKISGENLGESRHCLTQKKWLTKNLISSLQWPHQDWTVCCSNSKWSHTVIKLTSLPVRASVNST